MFSLKSFDEWQLLLPEKKRTFDWTRMIFDYENLRDSIYRCVHEFEIYNEMMEVYNEFGQSKCFQFQTYRKSHCKAGKLMTTVRVHDQFNATIHEPNDRNRGIKVLCRGIFINEPNLAEKNFTS